MPAYQETLKSKLPRVGTTIFTVMSQLAHTHGAINLSQGFPDFDCPPELISLVHEHMKKGHNQYSPMPGVPALREEIVKKAEKCYGTAYNPDTEVTVTAGGTQALFAAIAAVVHEGDEVIIFEPCYDSYAPAVLLQGGIPTFIQLQPPDFRINWNEVKKMVSQRTRMIILNSPHNPTGTVLSEKDIQQLSKIVKNTGIIILSDEVYEHIIFDNRKHHSMALYPDLAQRSFIVASFGKIYHATGWKCGYCLAPKELMTEFRKVHQFLVFCANTPLQHALADFMKQDTGYLELGAFFQEKRDYFDGLMRQTRFEMLPSHGSYFQSASFAHLSDERDQDFAERLTREYGVASIPNSAFYHGKTDHKTLRFCFAKKKETLEKAVEKLLKFNNE